MIRLPLARVTVSPTKMENQFIKISGSAEACNLSRIREGSARSRFRKKWLRLWARLREELDLMDRVLKNREGSIKQTILSIQILSPPIKTKSSQIPDGASE